MEIHLTFFAVLTILSRITRADDVTIHTRLGVGNSGQPIWKARVDELTQCAQACVKKKRCKAITYNSATHLCELHPTLLSDKTREGKSLVYSEFSWWPSEIDQACYGRPCGEYQVCIPMATQSHVFCQDDAKPVCPLPARLVGSRTVGSVNAITCPSGYTGGGSATCQENLEWSNTIAPCVAPPTTTTPAPTSMSPACPFPDPFTTFNIGVDSPKCTGQYTDPISGNCARVAEVTGGVSVGDEFVAVCDANFRGGGRATCIAGGTWNNIIEPCLPCAYPYPFTQFVIGTDQPKCEIEFRDPDDESCEHVDNVHGGVDTGDEFTVVCKDYARGGGTARCMSNGKWTKPIKPCFGTVSDGYCRTGDPQTCYKLMTTARIWEDSKNQCERTGGKLAMLEQADEHEFVKELLLKENLFAVGDAHGTKVYVFIGAKRASGNAFEWTDGTTNYTQNYNKWLENQPDGEFNQEDCMQYVIIKGDNENGYWNDGRCTNKDMSLCEYQGL